MYPSLCQLLPHPTGPFRPKAVSFYFLQSARACTQSLSQWNLTHVPTRLHPPLTSLPSRVYLYSPQSLRLKLISKQTWPSHSPLSTLQISLCQCQIILQGIVLVRIVTIITLNMPETHPQKISGSKHPVDTANWLPVSHLDPTKEGNDHTWKYEYDPWPHTNCNGFCQGGKWCVDKSGRVLMKYLPVFWFL